MERNKAKIFWYNLGIGIGIIFIVAFFTSQIFMPLFFGRAKTIEVPNVLKLSHLQANKILIDSKLHAIIKDSVWSEEVPAGKVISQKPVAGSMVKPDGIVYIVISRGSRSVKVPNIIGMNIQYAWIALRKVDLRFTVVDSLYSDIYPLNTVVQSVPPSGQKVERGSEIKIYISKGSKPNEEERPSEEDYNY